MTSVSLPPFLDADDWDNDLERSPAARVVIAKSWAKLDEWLSENAKQRLLTTQVIIRWHSILFEGVFPQFAGRVRSESFPVEVHIGSDRYNGVGCRYTKAELREYERQLQGRIRDMDALNHGLGGAPEIEIVKAAAWCHADFIRIHPFCDGNGRTGRLIVDYFAYRYDLEPVEIGRPANNEYLAAMGSYLDYREIDPLVSFLLPLMLPASVL